MVESESTNGPGLSLTNKILIGIALGVVAGFALGERAKYVEPLGTLFIRLLKMIIAPLMLCAIITGVASLGNLVKLGRMGGKALLWYTCTGLLAITNGLVMVNVIGPGVNSRLKIPGATEFEKYHAPDIVNDVLLQIVPDNVFDALAKGNMLSIIFFGALVGAALTTMGEQGDVLLKPVTTLYALMMKIVHWIMQVAPFGVFALVAAMVGVSGAKAFIPLMKYIATVMIGLAVHATVLLTILTFLARRSPVPYLRSISAALATSFGTASSSATLPVTYECLVEKAGISQRVASFFLPVSSMINSDGTAVYEAVAAVFIAQVAGHHLSLPEQITVFITAMAASIGAPGIPSAGMVTLVMVLRSVNLPIGGIALLAPVDRLLDQTRTMVNVLGDCVGAAILERSEGDAAVTESPSPAIHPSRSSDAPAGGRGSG